MVIIGVIFALIIRKVTENFTLPETELAKDDDWVREHLPLQDKETQAKIRLPVTQSFVKNIRSLRLNELRMTGFTVEIIVYFFYILLALLMAYGHRAPNAYDMTNSLNKMIITNKFDKVTYCLLFVSPGSYYAGG